MAHAAGNCALGIERRVGDAKPGSSFIRAAAIFFRKKQNPEMVTHGMWHIRWHLHDDTLVVASVGTLNRWLSAGGFTSTRRGISAVLGERWSEPTLMIKQTKGQENLSENSDVFLKFEILVFHGATTTPKRFITFKKASCIISLSLSPSYVCLTACERVHSSREKRSQRHRKPNEYFVRGRA